MTCECVLPAETDGRFVDICSNFFVAGGAALYVAEESDFWNSRCFANIREITIDSEYTRVHVLCVDSLVSS